jgi:GNAT superfamily N-acetyltransferase
MFDYFILGIYMMREAMGKGELRALIKRQISWGRVLTPVEMDLSGPLPEAKLPADFKLCFVELYPEDIRSGKWVFAVPSRGIKTSRKIKKGMRGFALVQDNVVIADIWCVFSRNGEPVSHPDLQNLGLTCRNREVYAFDMLIDPAYRGKNLAVPLQRAIQQTLKSEGFVKVYGFYYDDNLPALWMHRMLKFKEHRKRREFRFFSYSKSTTIDSGNTSASRFHTTPKGN